MAIWYQLNLKIKFNSAMVSVAKALRQRSLLSGQYPGEFYLRIKNFT